MGEGVCDVSRQPSAVGQSLAVENRNRRELRRLVPILPLDIPMVLRSLTTAFALATIATAPFLALGPAAHAGSDPGATSTGRELFRWHHESILVISGPAGTTGLGT